MTRVACLTFVAAVAALVVPQRVHAETSFRLQTFALSSADPKRCTSAQLQEAASQLGQQQLARVDGDADLNGSLACASGVVYIKVGSESVPQRTQSIFLRLTGRYGASFEQTASGTRLQLDAERLRSFLAERAAGCSIVAESPQSFRLEVVSETPGAAPLVFSHTTPHLLRGLKRGQAFRVHWAGITLEGCGSSDQLQLSVPAGTAGSGGAGGARASADGPKGAADVTPPAPAAARWWLMLVPLGALGVGAWLLARRRSRVTTPSKPRLGVFISYRRDDAGGYAGRLFDDLEQVFERDALFLDESSIGLGSNFEPAIERAIAKTEVMLILIGKQWVSKLQERMGSNDYVRFEVERGLQKPGYLVVPLLVGDAELPQGSDLPGSLQGLVARQAFELRSARWDDDVAELIKRLRATLPVASPTAPGLDS